MKWIAACVLFAASCGGGAGRLTDFEGTWRFGAGANETFTSTTTRTIDLTAFHFTLAAGTTSDLEMTSITSDAMPPTNAGWPNFRCTSPIHLSLDGSTASTASSEMCMFSVVMSGGYNYVATNVYYPLTLKLDAAGTTLTVSGVEQDTFQGSSPGSLAPAIVMLQGTATKQ